MKKLEKLPRNEVTSVQKASEEDDSNEIDYTEVPLAALPVLDLPQDSSKTRGTTNLHQQQVAQISRVIGNKATASLIQRMKTRRGASVNENNPYLQENKSSSNISTENNDTSNTSNESVLITENNESNSNDSNNSTDNKISTENNESNSNEINDNSNISNESVLNTENNESNSNNSTETTNSPKTEISQRKRRYAQVNNYLDIKNTPVMANPQDVIDPKKPLPLSFLRFLQEQNDTKFKDAFYFMWELERRFNKLEKEVPFDKYKAEGGVDEWIRKHFDKFEGMGEQAYDVFVNEFNPEQDSKKRLQVKIQKSVIQDKLEGIFVGVKTTIEDLCYAYNLKYGYEKFITDQEIFEDKGVSATKYIDSNLKGKSRLGKGGMNTVYLMDYRNLGKKVWKGDQETDYLLNYHNGRHIGIPRNAPEYAKRSVAMYKLDQLLGANVIPQTDFGVHEGKFGTLTDLASGESIMEFIRFKNRDKKILDVDNEGKVQFEKKLEKNKVFKNALAKLQLLDVLAGQVDRHFGNILVDYDRDKNEVKSLKGIDNDMAFGESHNDIKEVMGKKVDLRGGDLMGNSEYIERIKNIDRKFSDKIINLDPQELKDTLKELLKEEEVEATVKRLEQLQAYLKSEENKSKIVDY